MKPFPDELLALAAIEDEADYTGSPAFEEDEYPDYSAATSRVISGPLGLASFSGRRFNRYQAAQAHCNKEYDVIKFWTMGARWFCRIKHDWANVAAAGAESGVSRGDARGA